MIQIIVICIVCFSNNATKFTQSTQQLPIFPICFSRIKQATAKFHISIFIHSNFCFLIKRKNFFTKIPDFMSV